MPELKQLCVMEPEIITKYQQQYIPNDALPTRQEEDNFDPAEEYVPYLVHTHGNPPIEDKYHFLMLDMECNVQSKDIIDQDYDRPEITIDLKMLEQQISATSYEKPHSILVKQVSREDEDGASSISSEKDKISINWDPAVEMTERRRSLIGDKRRVSLTPTEKSSEMEWKENDVVIPDILGVDDTPTYVAILPNKQPRMSLLKDTVLDQLVREHKRRESMLPETPQLQAEALVQNEPVPQKHKFSLPLLKRDKRKKKFSKAGSDLPKRKREGSDSESSDDSSNESIRSSATKPRYRGASNVSAKSK